MRFEECHIPAKHILLNGEHLQARILVPAETQH
jgi:hypothetical protein